MLAKVDLMDDQSGNALSSVITELFTELKPSIDIVDWAALVTRANENSFDDFETEAQSYLTTIQNQLIELLKSSQEKALKIDFGIPFNPISHAMFTGSCLCHLMIAQQQFKFKDSRWIMASQIHEYSLMLKANSEPVEVMVWNRSDLFNNETLTENYAFKIHLYNIEQIQNFPKNDPTMDIDMVEVSSQLDNLINDNGIKIERLGLTKAVLNNGEAREIFNDVLLVSKRSLPVNTLFYSEKFTETQPGAELVALAATLLCVGQFDRMDDLGTNFISNMLGQVLLNHLPDVDQEKRYQGSELLKSKLAKDELNLENLVAHWIDGNSVLLEKLREQHSEIPSNISTMIKTKGMPETKEMKAQLQRKLEQALSFGYFDRIVNNLAKEDSANQKSLSYFDRFMKTLRLAFNEDQQLLDDLVEDKHGWIKDIFDQFMNKKDTLAPQLSKEAYFSTVSEGLARNLSNRLIKLSKFESDWQITTIKAQDSIQKLQTKSEQIERTKKLKAVNDNVNNFIHKSLYAAEFDYEKLVAQFNEIKAQLDPRN